jgi:hypothetical protein
VGHVLVASDGVLQGFERRFDNRAAAITGTGALAFL